MIIGGKINGIAIAGKNHISMVKSAGHAFGKIYFTTKIHTHILKCNILKGLNIKEEN